METNGHTGGSVTSSSDRSALAKAPSRNALFVHTSGLLEKHFPFIFFTGLFYSSAGFL